MVKQVKNTVKRLPDVLKYAIVILVIGFISLLCPNHIQFKYQYEKGQPWRYEALVSPFDFGILKTDKEIDAERSELLDEFSPYYEWNPLVGKAKKIEFEKDFEQQLEISRSDNLYEDVSRRPQRYKTYGTDLIGRVYQRGIIQLNQSHKGKGENFVINILKGNIAQKKTLETIPTTEKVNAWINDSLFNSRLPEAEFLIPLFENAFVPNIFYNDTLTNKFKAATLDGISTSRGKVERGETIVENGELITEETYQKLRSFEEQYKQELSVQRSYWGVFGGYILLTTLIVSVFLWYLQFNEKAVFSRLNRIIFIFSWLIIFSYLVYAVESITILSAYLIPFCIAPIVIKNFFNERVALFAHLVIILIASFLSSLGYEFTFLQILAGIVAVLTNTETRYWSRFFQSMLLILLTYAVGYFGLSLIQEGMVQTIDYRIYGFLFLNVLFTLLAYPIIPLVEKLFGFTSSITLAELTDLNRPLLKELSIKAPGTFQHSLQVANLSESAASKIGANALLVKAAALYHDIGKMKNPVYFIENQSGTNPHDDMDYLESARFIIDHVPEGVKIAKKYRIPNLLTNFIKTHHGTTRVEYFYRNFVNANPERQFDESLFRYPGPKPSSKEETILMIADSLEAACKSLKNPTGQDLDQLIDKIINGKISQGQLEDSELTFEELDICTEEFRKILRSIHHVRIEYPEEKVEN